jgi:GGDEF domain-containing protein
VNRSNRTTLLGGAPDGIIEGMKTPAQARRSRAGQWRFQQAFVSETAAQLHDLWRDLERDPDVAEPAAIELRRIAETAEALDLEVVARAAREAAKELDEGSEASARSLRRVGNALRHTGGRLRFGPIVVVGLTGEEADELLLSARLCCEPVEVHADLAGFVAALHTEQPAAIVLPVEELHAVEQLVGRERFPVLVHAAERAFEPRLTALAAGAHAVVDRPLALRDVTRLVRWHSQMTEEDLEVLVLADPSPLRDTLVAAVRDAGLSVRLSKDPAELPALVEHATPAAVVIGPTVAGVPAFPLALLVRAHPRSHPVPMLVFGHPDEPAALRACGVEDVMRSDANPALAANRIRDRIMRLRALPWERDPRTGWPTRLGVLGAIDEELAVVSRTGRPLTIALVELEGMVEVEEAFGPEAGSDLRRILRGVVSDGLRRTDLHGTLGPPGSLVLALPACNRDAAMPRLANLLARFEERIRGDERFVQTSLVVGVADTDAGLADVGVRAEQNLKKTAAHVT